jgi:hypothetical protein
MPGLLNQDDLVAFCNVLRSSETDAGRLDVLRAKVPATRFLAKQAALILKKFDTDAQRYSAAKLLYPRLVNPDDALEMLGSFETDATRSQLMQELKLK